ncbi:MAG: hypothetical protein AAGD86_06410 [Pseudomonadota bacterium]
MATTKKTRGTTRKKKTGSATAAKEAAAETATAQETLPESVADDALDRLGDFAQRAAEVVSRSANVLEEEIAAGILAARQVEEKFIDVDKLRGGDQNRFARRVRRDVHDVVDILVDLVETGVQSAGSLAQRAVKLRPARGSGSRQALPGNIPTLTTSAPLAAGGTAEINMTLENDSDAETEEFSFTASDLVNAAVGEQIDAAQVAISPSPVTIAPNGTCDVHIHVKVPPKTPPGIYSGLLQATRMDRLRAILTVQVT